MPSDTELDKMCNRSLGGIIDIRCKDNKGEPLRSQPFSVLSGDKQFNYTCSPEYGATCQTLSVNASCADFAIKIYCSCPPMPTSKYIIISDNTNSLL